MDLKKDEQFQQYYASMTASPSYSSSSNTSSPEQENYYNNGNYNLTSAENNGDDYFYEASELKQNDTYTDNDEDDAETEDEENEEGLNEQNDTTESHNGEIASPDTAIATSTVVESKKKKKRKKRDPNKPKGFVCASLKYANANRQRVKDANPNASFQEVVSPPVIWVCSCMYFIYSYYYFICKQCIKARMLSAEYKALSKKDAKVWIKLASDDRARYKKEMLSYVPPPSPPAPSETPTQISGGTTYSEEDNDSMQMISVEAPKSKKQKKSSSPKMPRTGWQLFSSSRAHQIIKTQHITCDCNEIQRILGQVRTFRCVCVSSSTLSYSTHKHY